ncbi:MAG: ABC transporter substrate-binding protein, partial [Patescibacteria group bacterium]
KVDRIKYKSDTITEINLSPNKKDLPRLVYKFFPNESQMINAYKLGQINQMSVTKKNLADVFTTWKNTNVEKTIDYSNLLTLFFNYKNPFFAEKEIRSAVKMSMDQTVFKELGVTAKSSIPPGSWAYNEDLKDPVYDPDLAKKIVKKYREATDSAKLNFNTFYDYLDIASVINENLNEIGLPTNLNITSFSNTKNFDLMLAFLKIPEDPDQYYYWHSTQNLSSLTGYRNLKVDKLLEDGRRESFDQKDRLKYYLDLQKNLDEDSAAVFIYFPYIYTISRK